MKKKIGKHLCESGFVKLLNHPGFQKFKKSHPILNSFAGSSLKIRHERGPAILLVQVSEQLITENPDNSMIFWAPPLKMAGSSSIESLKFTFEFRRTEGFPDALSDAFKQLTALPRKEISRPARQALEAVKQAFS